MRPEVEGVFLEALSLHRNLRALSAKFARRAQKFFNERKNARTRPGRPRPARIKKVVCDFSFVGQNTHAVRFSGSTACTIFLFQ